MEEEKKKKLPGTIEQTREELNQLKGDLRDMRERIRSGKEEMDSDKDQELDRMLQDVADLTVHEEQLEKLESMSFEKAAPVVKEVMEEAEIEKNPKKVTEEQAFEKWLRYGEGSLDNEDRAVLRPVNESGQPLNRAGNTPQTVTTTAGGYLIPTGFSNALDQAMLAYWPFNGVTVLNTASGNDLHYPTVNDTGVKGHLIGINTADTVADVTFSEVVFYAYMFTSYIVKVPLELIQDSYFDMQGLLTRLLAERLGRILADYFTTGTGSSQPEGIVEAATDAVLNPSASAISRDNILDLKHKVDSIYRDAPMAAFMFNDQTFKAIAKLTFGTSDDRPLWQASIASGQPDTIEGKRFYINPSMANIGASATSMLFGDLSKFVVRRVMGTTMFTFRELYMASRDIGYTAFCRYDSRGLDAGTHPIYKLVHAAT